MRDGTEGHGVSGPADAEGVVHSMFGAFSGRTGRVREHQSFISYISHSTLSFFLSTEHHHKMTLNAEQMRQLRSKVENFVYVSQQCSKKHLWFIAQLTELFAGLEVVQLDN